MDCLRVCFNECLLSIAHLRGKCFDMQHVAQELCPFQKASDFELSFAAWMASHAVITEIVDILIVASEFKQLIMCVIRSRALVCVSYTLRRSWYGGILLPGSSHLSCAPYKFLLYLT